MSIGGDTIYVTSNGEKTPHCIMEQKEHVQTSSQTKVSIMAHKVNKEPPK